MVNYILSMVMKLLLKQQLKDGLNGFVKAGKNLKMKHNLADLLPKQHLRILNRFAFLSMMILTLQ